MKKKKKAMTSQNLEEEINELKKPEDKPVEHINKSLIKRFAEYVEASYRDGVFGLSRYAFDIIKRTQLNLPILKYPSGKSGYNKKIKQLLKAAGLHRQGSGAVTHYTMLELADRFKLMNLAFDQEDYMVDKNLNVISLVSGK